ncbi:hypothetical protein ACI258_005166, partial [Salmonella enterica subsp. enterica serovar Montevideo]
YVTGRKSSVVFGAYNQAGAATLTDTVELHSLHNVISGVNNIVKDNVLRKRLARTVLIFTERSDQLSRATDRVPGLPASPGYVQ